MTEQNLPDNLAEAHALIQELRNEEELSVHLHLQMATILRRVAVALKGPNPPLGQHSWHDLGELTEQKIARIKELETRLEIDPRHNYDGIACRDVEIKELDEIVEKQEKQIQALLDHCPDGECLKCGEIICPHGEPLHFHHDGCPACYEREKE